ncbi:hypothetical protein PPACK8108_LOCUS9260 [Phakopsora pachyrhizi]|uniref:C2H2-type domain-containing protein n=1 Tax=Phakopsora pachyrhizi TaxID=170000 RepID=A0AAV0B0U4_PHAPC|nr:hypothetical protein PPACK8108_LOCUS9260 [Phakopsora pachyrhizi]
MSTSNTYNNETIDQSEEDLPMLRCGWNDCRQGFWVLEDLIDHLVGEGGHVPPDPSAPRGQKCPCEWNGCPKQGKPQGSRMALMVHLRSHTGEKPFCCHRPECDKTFSRTDALAKHVRVSHGENLPSFRGLNNLSNRTKRSIKLENESDQDEDQSMVTVNEPENQQADYPNEIDNININNNNNNNKRNRLDDNLVELVNLNGKLFDDQIDENLRTEEERMGIEDLKLKFPSSDPTFLELVVMKAKLKFVLGERELLKAELKVLNNKEEDIKKHKDGFLDQILREKIG